jgi:hypothetical protein
VDASLLIRISISNMTLVFWSKLPFLDNNSHTTGRYYDNKEITLYKEKDLRIFYKTGAHITCNST